MAGKAVLVVEPNLTHAVEFRRLLQKQYRVDHVRAAEEAKELLSQRDYAMVLLDCDPPAGNGLELQRWILKQGIDVPVIVTSSRADEPMATKALKLGAHDYIVKSGENASSLTAAVRHALRRHELERRAQILQQIVENASDGIITMEVGGRILTANPAVESVFGYAPDKIVGKSVTFLFPDGVQGDGTAQMLKTGAAGRPWRGELSARRKDGSLILVHMSTSVLRDQGGGPRCLTGIARDVTERRLLLEKLQRLSITDNLTGLFNHRFFHDRLHYEFIRARRYDEPLGCIMIDVDYFKTVNDTYGHLIGDDVLKSIAGFVTGATRSVDIVARYGGEEFAVLLPNTDLAGAARCAEHIWQSIGTAEMSARQGTLRLTVSAGVSALTPDVTDEMELLRRADSALLAAKRRGRNNVCVWDREALEPASSTSELEGEDLNELRSSLARLISPAKVHYLEAAAPLLDSLCRRLPMLRRHSANVTIYAMELAKLVGMTSEEEQALRYAALFHDVGHVLTPQDLLNKPGKLTPEEMRQVRQHVRASVLLISEMRVFDRELDYVRHHHERYDGVGYPDGLSGEDIPVGARILAIADAFDAMTSDRPYGKRVSEDEAISELRHHAGTQFDPRLVKLFMEARYASQPA